MTATEANRDFSRIFRDVARGARYVITAHGKPMVRMEPAAEPATGEDRAARLRVLADELGALPGRAPGPITREDGYA
ncbi:MAG: type II toxin-antitoxin system prevent-host-death family antitoxin [Brevundimonas sp.]|uniref:type II toxin-antitoxin system Phd/YefM family antitoxin n=1 Tax=Brevundimonas sp. TaxID=1871086 RepID=UPI00258A991C|nr:type II toxin-antitoxin system prevent-host-death family antitoxin [Brevundimonas sp.]MCV0415370.1 type II toxin-antitoxin system prevent-host-death family antitoxin [Brevundimonas sp.]